MVKAKKNNLHLEVSNDVDLEYETKSNKISLKAKPKKSGSFLIVNGKKIPLLKSSKKSGGNKISSKRGAKKASSSIKKGTVPKKVAVFLITFPYGKRRVFQKKPSKKVIKKTAKVSSALMKKRAASSRTAKGKSLQKKDLRRSSSSKAKVLKTKAPAKKIMPSLDDIKEFFGVKDKAQKESSSAGAPAKKLMPSSSTNDTKKVSSDIKENPQDSNSLKSSSTGSENSVSKTIYMPIKQEANGQTAEAIVIVVEDKEEKADLDLQNVKLVVKAEKENEKIFWSMI